MCFRDFKKKFRAIQQRQSATCPDERQKNVFTIFFFDFQEKLLNDGKFDTQVNFFRTGNTAASQCFVCVSLLGFFPDRKSRLVRQNSGWHLKMANTQCFHKKSPNQFYLFTILFVLILYV